MNSFALRIAIKRFAPKRADYYEYFARVLSSSKGAIKINQIVERDIGRYAGTPRGILSWIWLDRLEENGANLADAFRGTLPDDEVLVLAVAQGQEEGSVEAALLEMAKMARMQMQISQAIRDTLYVAFFGLIIALLMITLFPVYVAGDIRVNYGYMPIEFWGWKSIKLLAYSDWLKAAWYYMILVAFACIFWLAWSFENWTGPAREWVDKRIFMWRAYRDIRCASFMATMSTLTTRRGSTSKTALSAVDVLAHHARSPWLAWRIGQIKDLVEETGGSSAASFKTPLMSNDIYYFFQDMDEASNLTEGFYETSKYIDKSLLPDLFKKLLFYRYAIIGLSILMVIFVYVANISIQREMSASMRIYQTSR